MRAEAWALIIQVKESGTKSHLLLPILFPFITPNGSEGSRHVPLPRNANISFTSCQI